MLLFVARKIFNNKWLILCLLVGIITAVAMISSIPIYTDGMLQRLLTKDLENYQLTSGTYTGRYLIRSSLYTHYTENGRTAAYRNFDDTIRAEIIKRIDLPIIAQTNNIAIEYLYLSDPEHPETNGKKQFVKLEALQGLEDHIDMVYGSIYSSSAEDGVIEVIVTEEAAKNLGLVLGRTYHLPDNLDLLGEPVKVRVTGVFTLSDRSDPFWFQDLSSYDTSFIADYDIYRVTFTEGDFPLLSSSQWFCAFDYHSAGIGGLPDLLKAHSENERWAAGYRSIDLIFPAKSIFTEYYERERQLMTSLWVLQIPVFIMLLFYLFMISQLIIDNDSNEIAVFKSRGASSLQIFSAYALEGILLCGTAVILGPLAGMFLCRILGASSGFLEFVQRTALPLSLSSKAYMYAAAGGLISMITMLIPAVINSRVSIVEYKQKKTKHSAAIWKKAGFDIILLALAAYGLHTYNIRKETLEITGAKGTIVGIDPLLFIISTAFILGTGLLFLRLYPLLIRLITGIGKKIWSPVIYASLIQVGRSGKQNSFIMLFLILSLSVGLFNANSARTINSNIEEKLFYSNGSSVILMAHWESDRPAGAGPDGLPVTEPDPAAQYIEPDFHPYTQLSGAEKATKVFSRSSVQLRTLEHHFGGTQLMGIIPYDFARTAWFRYDLLPYHWYAYLNVLTANPRAVLLSSSFRAYGIEIGEVVRISWGNQSPLEFVVGAFIDYWPTYNPHDKTSPHAVIANLEYIHAKVAIEPYEVWIKKSPDATSEDLYDSIKSKKLKIDYLIDTDQEIIAARNDPMLQGINGALTLDFIVTIMICMIGFLIYWMLSIRKRELQFGILRAIGLGRARIVGMIACEQFLISGAAIAAGIAIGGIASELFVPLLQLAYGSAQLVPPFRVVSKTSDYVRLYSTVMVMLTAGLTTLGILVSRIKISQSIKLGED